MTNTGSSVGEHATASAADPVVSVTDFHKTFRVGFFRKKVEAVRGISFEVGRGETFGLLGPNGAGKTSTLKSLLRLTFPTSGELRIFGMPPSRRQSMARVGYMPENPYIYQYLSAPEFLDLCARLLGMGRKERKRRIAEMLELIGLGHAGDRPIGRFSKGMMQRAGLAQALLHDPELLILDEPMSGLDPVGRREIREVLEAQRNAGKTIIFTSHILSDVERLCDRVVVLKRGKIHAEGTIASLRGERVEVTFRAGEGASALSLEAITNKLNAPTTSDKQGNAVLTSDTASLQAILRELHDAGAEIHSVMPNTQPLEALFTDEEPDEVASGSSETELAEENERAQEQ